jgi:hypothetical protein
MYKTLTSALLAFSVSAQSNQWTRGFPPRTDNCETPKANWDTTTAATALPWGLERDTATGSCRCASEDAEWGPGDGAVQDWRCHCTNRLHYEERVNVGADAKAWDLNNKQCGAC